MRCSFLLCILVIYFEIALAFVRPLHARARTKKINLDDWIEQQRVTNNNKPATLLLPTIPITSLKPLFIFDSELTVVSTTAHAIWVETPSFRLTGKHKGRTIKLNGMIKRFDLPSGWAISTGEASSYIAKNTIKVLKTGSVLLPNTVFVSEVHLENGRFVCGLSSAYPDPASSIDFERATAFTKSKATLRRQEARRRKKLNSLIPGDGKPYAGTITRVLPYGVFVDIGASRDGLLHVRKIGKFVEMELSGVEDVSEYFNVYDKINVLVVAVEGNKFELDLCDDQPAPVPAPAPAPAPTQVKIIEEVEEVVEEEEFQDEDDVIEDKFF